MYLIAHTGIALNLTPRLKSVWLAFGVGFLSHFLVDAVPHGDELVGVWARGDGHDGVLRLGAVMILDLALVAAAYLWSRRRFGWSWVGTAALAGACLPDLAWGFERLIGQRLFGPLTAWHHAIHNFLNVEMSVAVGLLLQAAVVVYVWRRVHA